MKRVIGLTGTIAPNGYEDMWSQIFLLDRGQRLGKTITEFRRTYFYPILKGNFTDWVLKEGSADIIQDKIKDICISMKARDYLPMTELTFIDKEVTMTNSEKKEYNRLAKDSIAEIMSQEVVALSSGALSNKLQQLANGAFYKEDHSYITFHDHKLDALESIIESSGDEPILIGYWFKSDFERIKKRFKDVVDLKEDPKLRDKWNKGKIKLAAAHPASLGHGLNLQEGGHIIVWFGLTWNLELYQQMNARLDRQGQKNPVLIYRIITKGTEDERIIKALSFKGDLQDAIKDALDSFRKEYLKS